MKAQDYKDIKISNVDTVKVMTNNEVWWKKPMSEFRLNDLGWFNTTLSTDTNYARCSCYLSAILKKYPKINKYSVKFNGDIRKTLGYGVRIQSTDLINRNVADYIMNFAPRDDTDIKRKIIAKNNEVIVEYYDGNYITRLEGMKVNKGNISYESLKSLCESLDFRFTVLSVFK